MGILYVYFHPVEDLDCFAYNMDLEKELSIADGMEVMEDLLRAIGGGLLFDYDDYLCDIDQHYVLYFESPKPLEHAKKIYEYYNMRLPKNSEIVIKIGEGYIKRRPQPVYVVRRREKKEQDIFECLKLQI